jgi:hypothetical protein
MNPQMGTEPDPTQVSRDTPYFSERADEWRPLWRLPEEWDEDGYDYAKQARDGGIKYLEFLGSGHDDDCDACKAHECQIVPIQPTPPFPIHGCQCQPWSRGIYLAVSDERAAVPFHVRREELVIRRENDRRSREVHAAALKQRRKGRRTEVGQGPPPLRPRANG